MGPLQLMYTRTVLNCEHVQLWRTQYAAPKRGDRLYCFTCADMRIVVGTPDDWTVACVDCSFRSRYIDGWNAGRGARRHLAQNLSHRMQVTDPTGQTVTVWNREQDFML